MADTPENRLESTIVVSYLTARPARDKEDSTLEDEIMRELHEIRATIASEHDNDSRKLDAFY